MIDFSYIILLNLNTNTMATLQHCKMCAIYLSFSADRRYPICDDCYAKMGESDCWFCGDRSNSICEYFMYTKGKNSYIYLCNDCEIPTIYREKPKRIASTEDSLTKSALHTM